MSRLRTCVLHVLVAVDLVGTSNPAVTSSRVLIESDRRPAIGFGKRPARVGWSTLARRRLRQPPILLFFSVPPPMIISVFRSRNGVSSQRADADITRGESPPRRTAHLFLVP